MDIYTAKQYLKEIANATRNYDRMPYTEWEVRYAPMVKNMMKNYPNSFGAQGRVTLDMLKLELQLRMSELVLEL